MTKLNTWALARVADTGGIGVEVHVLEWLQGLGLVRHISLTAVWRWELTAAGRRALEAAEGGPKVA